MAVPTVAPRLSAASASVQNGVSVGDVWPALIAGAGTALVLWIAVVWPSLRLGFRVKRARRSYRERPH